MNTFLITIDATTTVNGGTPPTLEVLVGGAVVSSAVMQAGANTYNLFVEYTGAVPSSVSLRFDAGSGDPADTITFTAVEINDDPLNLVTDLSTTVLTQGTSSSVTAPADVYGHTVPTLGAPTITGTGGDDVTLNGTNGADIIDGLAGNDRIRGLGDDDAINGGAGDDFIFGEDGADTILGGSGNDIIFGNADDDIIYGEGDNDYLIGGDGNDILNGGAGADGLIGDAGDDVMFGEDGDDWLSGDDGDDVMFGDDGNDIILGGADNDALSGGDGNDQIYGGTGNDLIDGGADNDEIVGGTGDDTVTAGTGADNVYGGDGTDDLSGGGDNDYVSGGDGTDILNGDGGADVLNGGTGADTLNGGTGNDFLHGHGLDADTISNILIANPNVIYSEDTGSFYQFVDTKVDWEGAITAAQTTTLSGVAGHLVTITSSAENTVVYNLAVTNGADNSIGINGNRIWLAGTDSAVDQEWVWSAGPENGIQFSSTATATNNMYENWGSGQPNNSGGNQTRATMWFNGGADDDAWDDRDDTDRHDYVIEWEGGLFSDDNAADTLNGDAGNDFIYGYGGDDILNGGADNDTIFAGIGSDTADGGSGTDVILGNEGDDTLNGGTGDDTIYGGDGDDTLNGDANNDTIYGDDSTTTTVMESGVESVTQTGAGQWHSVTFTESITNAVVKMFGQDVAGDPFTLRVRNITSNGFEFQIDEYDYQDGVTPLENISWMAVASGSHTLSNGMQIQAGFTTATNESLTGVSFVDTTYTNPIVFSQVSSDNEAGSAVVTRNRTVTSSGFSLQMQEQESNPNFHATEDIGWIAIESGGSAANGMLAGTTGDVVTHATRTINFGGTFSSAPVFLADMQTTDGGDTANTAGISVSTTQAQVLIDEEQSADGEVSHTTENVGYIALDQGVYEVVTETNGSDVIRGGDGDDILYADSVEDTNVQTPSASNPLAGLILDDNPDAYWDLGEAAGTTADNQGSLGSSVDGTIQGGATLGAAPLYTGGGTSIDFDGTNDRIPVPDSVGINTGTYAERTVELVFNADDVTTRQVLYEEGGTTNGLTIYLDGGNVYVTGEDDGDWVDANINASVSTGVTYHIAFVFDQPNNSFTGYLDGVNMGSVTVNNAIFPSHGANIGIGYAPDGVQFHDGESGSGGFHFDGRISDVALYNRALTQAELQSHSDIVQGIFPAADPIDDTLYGGDGFDQFFAGAGRDVFVFEAASAFNDIDEINGFDVGEQDAVDISDILTGFTVGVSDINDFVQITTVGSDSRIAVDANGAVGGTSFTNIAQINDFVGATVDSLYINHSIIPV